MPPLETAWRYQKAVLWPALTLRGRTLTDKNGQARVNLTSPVTLAVRWEDDYRDVLDPQGNTVALSATVVVAQDVVIGSRMWQGELTDWLGTGSGDDAADVMIVVTKSVAKDVKGKNIRRELGLMRYGDSPEPG